MTTRKAFTEAAPRIATIFTRRHLATGNLCLLGTLRSDGFPRISPMEPRVFEEQLCGNDGLNWPHCDGFNWPHLRPMRVPGFELRVARAGGRGRDGIQDGAVRADQAGA